MKPYIPSKPPAPSVTAIPRPAVERARLLRRDELPRNRTELIDDIERELRLPQTLLDLMRERARKSDESG